MQITHEEARRLIQFKVDHRLNMINDEKLGAHLQACIECRSYFEAIKDTESVLRRTLRKQWNASPLPLQMKFVYEKLNAGESSSIFLTTRKVIIGFAFVLMAFITWQSMIVSDVAPRQSPLGAVPLIPTPSTQYTATNPLEKECQEIRYMVQEGDTLESIAHHFFTSTESILLANYLTDESLDSITELVIPFCESTPASTTHPPTFTITPIFETITTTPG